MTVKSSDLDQHGRTGRADYDPLETGVVDEQVMALAGVWFVRAMAVVLVVYTTFGTFVPAAGGWAALQAAWVQHDWGYFRTPRGATAAGLTLIAQILLMWGQWSGKTNLVIWWRRVRYCWKIGRFDGVMYAGQYLAGWALLYVLLLLVSSVPSTYTYATWTEPLWTAVAEHWGRWIVAGIFTLSVIGDMIPEIVLVRREAPDATPEEA